MKRKQSVTVHVVSMAGNAGSDAYSRFSMGAAEVPVVARRATMTVAELASSVLFISAF